jgi:putative ABC transport system permease protein
METFWQDLRHGLRTLKKWPGYAAVAILTLGLGVGANTALFTVVNSVLLRPLTFPDPSRLVLIEERSQYPTFSTSYENYKDWRDQSHSFESMQAFCPASLTLNGVGEPEQLIGRYITSGFFPLLGVRPAAGRDFLPEEDRPDGAPVAIISYGLWQRRFGGSKDWIGKTITLDSKPYALIGVAPQNFQFLRSTDVFLPFEPWAKTLPDDRNWHPGVFPIGRLKPGVSLEQARAEMKGIAQRLEKQYPIYNTGTSADVIRLQDRIVHDVRPALLVLLCAVGFILLIACANVASLLLARTASRTSEIAIRTALGASRGRIIRQFLTESLLIALLGGASGLLIASASLPPLLRLSANAVPGVSGIRIDHWVLAFTLGASLLAGVLYGLAPAFGTSRIDLRESLNDGTRGSTAGMASHRLRSFFVVAEVALATILLVGAGLLLRSFERMQSAAAGFSPDHLLVADIPLSPNAYAQPHQRFEFFDRLLEHVRSIPGVRSVGAASFLPMSGNGGLLNFNIYGRPPKSPHEFVAAGFRTVTPSYLETLNVPLISGRMIAQTDDEKAPAVVVVNESFSKQFFGSASPLGARMQIGAMPDKDVPWMEIVGVVGDVRRGFGFDPQAEMYLPYKQSDALLPIFTLSIVLRTGVDPKAESSALRDALMDIDKNAPLVRVRTMEDNIAATASQPRFRTWLLGLFALLALLLSTIGIYAVISYAVTQRIQEIGIRMALGAKPAQIFRIITGQSLRLVLFGLTLGFMGALGLTRAIGSFLYELTAIDPATYVAVAALLVAVGILASYLPARRAASVDPLIALRYE